MRLQESIGAEKEGRIHPGLFNPRYHHFKELKRQIQYIILTHVSKRAKGILIDQGCGSMPYRDFFEPYVERYTGADIADNKAAEIQISNGIMDVADASAEIVLSTQVLEHVTDPAGYLNESNRVLKKDGLLILSTHGIWRYHPDPTDLWRWTADGLKKIIEAAGFEIMEVRGIMGLASTGLQLFQDAFIFKLPKFLLYPFVIVMQLLIVLFDKVHSDAQRAKDACVFFIVAKKK